MEKGSCVFKNSPIIFFLFNPFSFCHMVVHFITFFKRFTALVYNCRKEKEKLHDADILGKQRKEIAKQNC